MTRFDDIRKFAQYSYSRSGIIEPDTHYAMNREKVMEVLSAYNPEVIVKTGVGSGRLLADMAAATKAFLVVVEPSLEVIESFIQDHAGSEILEKIRFINGEFNNFPVDYYAADLIVCIDYLNFVESGKVIDEFRRALQFDGILFVATTVLNEEDMDGLLDDYTRNMFPLHNEYYLPDELRTVLTLNEFKFIKGSLDSYESDMEAARLFFSGHFGGAEKETGELLGENNDAFNRFYGLHEGKISIPYYSGVFMRIKPDHIKI